MNSMTGFGRATTTVAGHRYTVEIRSVNHRGLEVKVRGRDVENACELEILRAVRHAFDRGAIGVSVREDGDASAGIDPDRLRSLHRALDEVRRQLKLPDPVTLDTVAAFLGAAGGGDGAG